MLHIALEIHFTSLKYLSFSEEFFSFSNLLSTVARYKEFWAPRIYVFNNLT